MVIEYISSMTILAKDELKDKNIVIFDFFAINFKEILKEKGITNVITIRCDDNQYLDYIKYLTNIDCLVFYGIESGELDTIKKIDEEIHKKIFVKVWV